MSEFNPDTFLDTETEKAGETSYTPIRSDDYQAIIDDVVPRMAGDNPVLDVIYEIMDDDLKKEMGLERVTVRQSIFLDMNNGVLEFGANKNIKLNRVREAVGQNLSGKPWSPRMLKGQGPVTIRVTQRPDKNDPDTIYNDVSRVTSAA